MRHLIVLLAAFILGCTKMEMENLPEDSEAAKAKLHRPVMVISEKTETVNGVSRSEKYFYDKGQLVRFIDMNGQLFDIIHEPEHSRFLFKGPVGNSNNVTAYYYDRKGFIIRAEIMKDGNSSVRNYSYRYGLLYEQLTGPATTGSDYTLRGLRYQYHGLILTRVLDIEKIYNNNVLVAENVVDTNYKLNWKGHFDATLLMSEGYRVYNFKYSHSVMDPYYHDPFKVFDPACLFNGWNETLFPGRFHVFLGYSNYNTPPFYMGMLITESTLTLNDVVNGALVPEVIQCRLSNVQTNTFKLPISYLETISRKSGQEPFYVWQTKSYKYAYIDLRSTF
ncbi:MAG: hypothetical protein WBP58_11930 [Chitinophagaceae bacterium]